MICKLNIQTLRYAFYIFISIKLIILIVDYLFIKDLRSNVLILLSFLPTPHLNIS